MVSFKEYCNKKIDEADLGFVEPGLDKGDQGTPYKFKRNNQYIVVEDKNYKLTSKDKKDLKELFEVWDYLKNNIGNELRNFEENNIYRNDVAQFRMEKVRKLLPILNQMKLDWLSKYVKG